MLCSTLRSCYLPSTIPDSSKKSTEKLSDKKFRWNSHSGVSESVANCVRHSSASHSCCRFQCPWDDCVSASRPRCDTTHRNDHWTWSSRSESTAAPLHGSCWPGCQGKQFAPIRILRFERLHLVLEIASKQRSTISFPAISNYAKPQHYSIVTMIHCR